MRRLIPPLAAALLAAAALGGAVPGAAAAAECEPKASCFGLESVSASLSTYEAGAHPDVTFSFALKQDPESEPNALGLHESYAPVRDVRIELPAGLAGNPDLLGASQQCPASELAKGFTALCPNGSQVGLSKVYLHGYNFTLTEPVYMMAPPEGSDVVARLGLIAGIFPTFIDLKVRSQSDYGITAEILNTAPSGGFVRVDTTTWGVPAAKAHDTQRCTPAEALSLCTESEARPPGSLPLAFMTNPTRCGAQLALAVSVDSWAEPGRYVGAEEELEPITGCDGVPFNPSLYAEPTSHRAGAPTGLELSFRLPAPDGVEVLESSDLKDLRIEFPEGMGINTATADGLATCSPDEVKLGENVAAQCPDAAKLGETEFDVPALPRRMKGAIYLRAPEPGHLFRVWVVADDLGAHIKLPGELEVNEETGQIASVVADLPQFPVREVSLVLKSGLRAPLVNPPACGTYQTHYEFVPWARPEEAIEGQAPMRIDEGCEEVGGFEPKLQAGSTSPAAGQHAPFVFSLSRQDGEQNPASLEVSLPPGLAATFAGIPRCEGAEALSGACPAESLIGRVQAAAGAGPRPLWVPQEGKRPTAVYLGAPYRGAPLSAIAVVPAQAGPFDLGDVVVRSAIYVDPETARATVRSDPLPQLIQGVPVLYRTTEVILDRPGFTLNPTNCSPLSVDATVRSAEGATAQPSAYFQAAGCPQLPFKPKLRLSLLGTHARTSNPRLIANLTAKPGEANIARTQVTLPQAAFLDNSHIGTVCTRVQFREDACPAGSVYGRASAITPLFDQPLSGTVYLRSSDHPLPDLVVKLRGPAGFPIEVDLAGRTDSAPGGALRNTFEAVPDAPVSSFHLELFGGHRGLVELSRDLCAKTYRATVKMTGQNGKRHDTHPALGTSCGGSGGKTQGG